MDPLFGFRQDTLPTDGLLARMPRDTRGRLTANEPLAPMTWFRCGGAAEVFFRPADEDDLIFFLKNCPKSIPLTIIGVASNLLVRDGGIPGVVIKLPPSFAQIKVDGPMIYAGAGAIDLNVARAAQNAGVGGLEFLCGIPGTIGGGLRMNAGAYGREFKDVVQGAVIIDRAGDRRTLTLKELGLSYRHSSVAKDTIFVHAILAGEPSEPASVLEKMRTIQKNREQSQPIREKTGGSTFANPEDKENRKAWQLIEGAGCRGIKIGQAKVSEKHCNFLINTGNASAMEIEHLGEEVRTRVKQKFNIDLRWEIQRVGVVKEGFN